MKDVKTHSVKRAPILLRHVKYVTLIIVLRLELAKDVVTEGVLSVPISVKYARNVYKAIV